MTASRTLLLSCSLLLTSALVPAQGRRGPVRKPTEFTIDAAHHLDATKLILKFQEGTEVRLRNGAFAGRAGVDLAAVRELTAAAKVERVFLRSEAELDQERAQLLAALPPVLLERIEPPADLNLYYRVVCPDAATGLRLYRALNELAVVEIAFPDHLPTVPCDPGDIAPPTPDFFPQQTYQSAAPTGIDTRVARVIPGGRGEQLQVCDVETGLILDHEDVPLAIAANVIGPNNNRTDHGLAVAGEMVADKNGYGITGGIYKARYKFHSHQSVNWASSVNTAAAASQPGDIVVLEVQLTFTGGQICPMEVRQDVFDATRNATLAGKHVIAAAGNGSNDLDLPVFNNLFNRTVRDSGAVIVGATEGSTLVRASFSNHGSIVDANGWGRNVVTTGYTDLFFPNSDQRQKYTAVFSGTSSATPIVTSAGAATLSAAKQQLGVVFTPAQLRTLLQQNGTDVPNGRIGKRPNLALLFPAAGIQRPLTLRNEVNLGGTLILDIAGPAGDLYLLLAAAGPASLPTSIGRFLLDPVTLFPVRVGTFPAAGPAAFSTVIPNDTALLYQESHWQAFRFDLAVIRTSLTNSVLAYIER